MHTRTHTQLHKTGKKLVLEQIVTTIATLADSVEAYFIPHYDHFMPSLKYIMINATDKEYRLLRGKTIECISLMGLAVGQEKVRGEARGRRGRKSEVGGIYSETSECWTPCKLRNVVYSEVSHIQG